MSRGSTSLLFVLQRCVAGRQATLRTGITTRCSSSSVLSARCTATQQPTWASTTRAVCELQSAVRSSRYRFCTKAAPPCEDEYPPLPTYQVDPAAEEERKKEVFIMQVKGLPWSCSAQELLKFFSGLDIVEDGITVVLDHKARNSGEAFVQFSSHEAAGEALQRHREVIGNRYIEVFPSRRDQVHSGWKKKTSAAPASLGMPVANRTASASQNRTDVSHDVPLSKSSMIQWHRCNK
ncbi:G-rich sequence factor 1 [Liparis tanakae]|uniref:G-rich sequence factor 1 n=1 Tax=Liparis tanakae TaxID=230148 RepID=A0A4Z2GZV8_9TELE|nr:G-rich sequence factor 1 [Liparis tanakae]